MYISINWLKELIEFDLTAEDLAHKLTMSGFEVEGIEDRRTWADGVVLGQIITADRHPNADKLQVCSVDVGAAEKLEIVCGAANARAGIYVAVATIGTYLPRIDLKIKSAKLRGVKSSGMICSLAELGLTKDSEGIYEFSFADENIPALGSDVRPWLGLDDVILDVTSTANRADALSMVGIAREVAAFSGGKLSLPEPNLTGEPKQGDWVSVEEPKGCPAYSGSLIKGIKIAESPTWLKQRLVAAGMRPISNIVDITNFVMLEWGQPLHAFDANKLAENLQIGVRFARASEKEQLKTLDDQKRDLQNQSFIITSGDRPVALAGLIGGADTEVGDQTVDIMLEAALFDSATIRRSARAHGLRTEASARFERGVNFSGLETARDRAIQLILEIAGGELTEQSVVDNRAPLTRTIELRLSRVQEILGSIEADDGELADLPAMAVEQTLATLGFELQSHSTNNNGDRHLDQGSAAIKWLVKVPSYRYADIEREIDLIEEVARIYGYDKFVETLPDRTELGFLSLDYLLTRQLREILKGVGLTELVHVSLTSPTEDNQVLVANPAAAEFSALRKDLLAGLIDAFASNISNGNGSLWGYEIGSVFWLDEEGSNEATHLGGILGGDPTVGVWQKSSQPINWYEAKGMLETVFHRLGVEVEYQPDRADARLHPGRTASLWIDGNRLGVFGQLHPELIQQRELPDQVYVFELDLFTLLEAVAQLAIPIFKTYSTYPSSDRDIAFFAANSISVAELQRSIKRSGGALLESVDLFDQYIGKGVPEGQRSLAFRLVYRASDRTLTDEDVNKVHQQVRDNLEEKFSVSLRS
ncbi:phenylalanyl-tRNA synthetase beta subunit [Thalassoporum mexicanum PCC 7367]|uniref:phenylalanine--tRNA ligase subunit beta n=1 Tax=Thalassoporum mexicanum TaxID=3457544 RepID=UPI00029FB74F|nr:phenylalanine--tRNA ligase subunit beta [Pseudanabaena sp. PCC 7367]AFY71095.1 phenylalanyl-tRNA synthetase beta subunit [Pseudanabaena sp. PCC 7367]